MTKRILKYVLFFFLGIAVLIIASGLIINYFYKDKAIAVITSEINKQLKTKIDVRSISFSVFSHFPQASIQFNDILIHSSTALNSADFDRTQTDTLLFAKQISLGFNLFNLLQKKYVFERITATDGKVFVLLDKNGNTNLDILKSSNTNANTSPVNVKLNSILLKDMELQLHNASNSLVVDASIYDAAISGNFYEKNYRFKIKSNALLKELSEEAVNFVDYRELSVNTQLAYRKDIYTITNGNLLIDHLPFIVTGTIATHPATNLQLHLKGNNINIETLLGLLPVQWKETISDYKSSGNLTIDGDISGIVDYKTLPSITAQFSINQGSVNYQPQNMTMKDIVLHGRFSNGKMHSAQSTTITVDSFQTTVKQSTISGYFNLKNLTAPHFTTRFDINGALQSWAQFFPMDSIEILSGNLAGHLALSGTLKNLDSLTTETIKSLKNNSRFSLQNGALKFKNQSNTYSHINGNIHFADDDAIIDSVRFKMNKQFVSLSGRIYHYLSLLDNSRRQLKSNLTIKTSYLNVNDFLKAFSDNNTQSSDESLNLNTRLQLAIDTLDYDKLHITHLSANAVLQKNAIHIEQYNFRSLEGETTGSLDFTDLPNEKTLRISAYLNHININKLFVSFDDFGQDFITHKNLNGYVTTNVSFATNLNNSYKIIPESIISNAQITIKNGELIHFEPMQKLSKFTRIKDLSDVHFKTLSNEIFIEKSKIIIPEMTISADQFSLDLSGTHNFAGIYEYHLHLLLSELLSSQNDVTEFGTVEPNTNKTSLYLLLTGTANDSKLKYDTKATGQHIKNRLKEEKETLKQILREEFGRKKKKKKKAFQKQKKDNDTEGGWIIE